MRWEKNLISTMPFRCNKLDVVTKLRYHIFFKLAVAINAFQNASVGWKRCRNTGTPGERQRKHRRLTFFSTQGSLHENKYNSYQCIVLRSTLLMLILTLWYNMERDWDGSGIWLEYLLDDWFRQYSVDIQLGEAYSIWPGNTWDLMKGVTNCADSYPDCF